MTSLDQIVFVTGANGGIGASMMHAYSQSGATVIGADRTGRAGRPAPRQPRIHPDDLPDRSLRAVAAGPLGEPHPNGGGEMMLEGGVVGLRHTDLRGVQHPPVDRQPLTVHGLHLVRQRDVVCR